MAGTSDEQPGNDEQPRSEEQPRADEAAGQAPSSMGASRSVGKGAVADAEVEAARISTAEHPLGPPGPPLNRRSPFLVGFGAAAGVAVMAGLVEILLTAREMLLLIGVSLFIALGLEPVVSWFARRRVPRPLAVLIVLVAFFAVVAGFLAAAVPPLVGQASQFAQHVPAYLESVQNPHSLVGRLNTRFGLAQHAQQLFSTHGSSVSQGLLGAGRAVLSGLSSTLVGLVLVIYFLATMPMIRRALYRLVPASRRPRAVLLGDETITKIGGYVLGMAILAAIAGIASFLWLVLLGVPYPLLLAALVALLDIVPVVGSVTAGVIASLVALTVSVPVGLATVGYFVVYRLAEDYLLLPQIIGRTVQVPAVATVLAVLLGGTLLGVLGAVVAIPLAAVILLLLRETLVPRLDNR